MSTTVADHIVSRLQQWGVRQVFGYPGDGINGLIGAFGRADNQPQFIQARHEEMAAFEATGYAKFSGSVGVCMATSGPGAIHLLNGLYDAKLDHVPVVAIVGQTARSAMGGSYQQEVDLQALFKDVASDYLVEVNVASQLPNALDRAFRTAQTRRAPTVLIISSDLQEEPYQPPEHAFKQVPSSDPSNGYPVLRPSQDLIAQAAEVLNAGSKVAILIGQGARNAAAQVLEVADLTGAGIAKALLGKDVLRDDLSFVTGSIGLLGTRPSYELMRDCDTLLIIGSNFPYSQFLPEFGQARAVQIDVDGAMIGMRYPTEVNIVAGDGAMQMNGLLELLTIRRYYQQWEDPRLVVCVFHNNDLNQVTWELRAMGGEPKFEESQLLPEVSYAEVARTMGLHAIAVDDPDLLGAAWDSALSADRPTLSRRPLRPRGGTHSAARHL